MRILDTNCTAKPSNTLARYIYLLIPLIVWVVYTFAFNGKLRVLPYRCNYFKDLSISFSQGRLDVDPAMAGDLIFFKGKKYLYWPPVPALVYMPFTAIFGVNTPDALIVGLFGAVNVYLLMVLLALFSKKYELGLSCAGIGFLAVFWGLGTVHFYMSMVGSVWFVAQIMAQTFLMLSIICILSNTYLATPFLSGVFYSLAVYTRNTLLFAVFLIVAIYITINKDKVRNRKVLIRDVMAFLAPFVVFSLINLGYNWMRFESVFDNGVNYHKMNPRFAEDFSRYGCFSLHYVPGNFIREVVMPPPFTGGYPFFKLDIEGFGLLWASPVFIFVFAAAFYYIQGFSKHILRRRADSVLSRDDIVIMSAAAISGALISLVIFTVMGTGWSQFASRYSLDYQLMMLLFGVFIVRKWNNSKVFYCLLIILLIISIHMNYFGMKYYLRFDQANRATGPILFGTGFA